MAKQRIVRQKAAEEDGDESDLGGDVAMVGSVDDNIIVVSDDDDDKTKTVEDGGEGDDWDLPASKKGGQVPARTKAEETDEEGEEEDDLRTAYDEGDEGLNERRTPSRRSRRNRSRRESLEARDAEIMQLRGVVGQMAEQMQRLQHGQLGIAANTVDGQLSSARQAVALADQEMAKAVTEGDGKSTPRSWHCAMKPPSGFGSFRRPRRGWSPCHASSNRAMAMAVNRTVNRSRRASRPPWPPAPNAWPMCSSTEIRGSIRKAPTATAAWPS
jgi:hypothetical protein